jgi:ankyrin repeat protein
VVRILQEKGADPTAENAFGFTPLRMAKEQNHKAMMKLLGQPL